MKPVELLYLLFTNKRFIIGFGIIFFELMLAFMGPLLYPVDPFDTSNPPSVPPSEEYPFGTDRFGKDVFALVMYGIRNSLYVGVLTGLFTILIGLTVGLIAGIKGGIVDEVLMSLTNVVMIIPNVLLAILILTYVGVERSGLELVAAVLSITAWTGFARAVRAQILSLREREFIYLSRMAGLSTIKTALQDLLPHLATFILISFVNYMNVGINGEVGLSILGLTSISIVTLGKLLYFAAITQAFLFGQWWTFLIPGVILILLSASLLLIATAIDEVFNPRLRRM
ncbi:MAG: ABC transporter permease [Thermosphaera sp.]